jgi:hypothetical protein
VADFYLVNRILNNGRETELGRFTVGQLTDAEIAALRDQALSSARIAKGNGWRVVVYGPTEGDVPHTVDDRVWDSAVNL